MVKSAVSLPSYSVDPTVQKEYQKEPEEGLVEEAVPRHGSY